MVPLKPSGEKGTVFLDKHVFTPNEMDPNRGYLLGGEKTSSSWFSQWC